MKNFNIVKEICQEISTSTWFYSSTITDAIEYYCHKHSVSLSEKEKNDCTNAIKKVFENINE